MKPLYKTLSFAFLLVNTSIATIVDPNPNNWPDSLTFKNVVVPTPSTNGSNDTASSNPNLGGVWTKDTNMSQNNYIAYRKTLPDGSVLWYDIRIGDSPVGNRSEGGVEVLLSYYGGGEEAGWPEFWTVGYEGSSLNDLTLARVEPNFGQPDEDIFRSWVEENLRNQNFDSLIAGGINELGTLFLTGGDPGPMPNEGNSAVYTEQALELNIGLIFEDGQWTPQN
jgi:hypothetical protein